VAAGESLLALELTTHHLYRKPQPDECHAILSAACLARGSRSDMPFLGIGMSL